jgi:hypothetical protein
MNITTSAGAAAKSPGETVLFSQYGNRTALALPKRRHHADKKKHRSTGVKVH